MLKRRSKENYYLDIADAAQERSTCLRRRFGAIIVRDDEIVSTGYNGAPRGRRNCTDLKYCARQDLNIHAEANAIISAARRDMLGATLYLVGRDAQTGEIYADATPCAMCRRLIINAGIHQVVCRTGPDEYTVTLVRDWVYNDDTLK